MSHDRPEYRKTPPTTITAAEFQTLMTSRETEEKLQERCVIWFAKTHPDLLLFAVGNGGFRRLSEAIRMKRCGIVPDLVLAYPHNGKSGLFIELKTTAKHSKPSPAQITVQAHLRSVGYEVAMPRTFDEFQQVVNEYLQGY